MVRITLTANYKERGKRYQIIVRGHLESSLQQWFNGMGIRNLPEGEASLTGHVIDQAQLQGILTKVQDLGLPLISVQCLD
jgi:hypothetical protein